MCSFRVQYNLCNIDFLAGGTVLIGADVAAAIYDGGALDDATIVQLVRGVRVGGVGGLTTGLAFSSPVFRNGDER